MLYPPPAVQKVQFDPGKVRAGVSSVRILVVEDFPEFRRFVRSTLGERNDLQIIGEAADGLEAVQKAVELKPDLILMDIGLPSLNGLEAARRIFELVPESKIIFLSQESSAEVKQAALNMGACGYVVKAKAASELMPAIYAAV
jgi:DNA-binding NarL/FixJ family response regulator